MPQLNANSSSIELLDVDQIEFVRGPQSALFGRNTLGGAGQHHQQPAVADEVDRRAGGAVRQLTARGRCAAACPGRSSTTGWRSASRSAQVSRDGFTVNDVTGNDIDSRSAFSARPSCCGRPTPNWEARVIVTGERARDGDYALNDVAALRANPFHAARDFEGFTNRDVFGTTIQARRTGGPLVFSSTTGFVNWKTAGRDRPRLHAAAAAARATTPKRTSSSRRSCASRRRTARRSSCPTSAALRWQAGVFLFTQGYEQDAVNSFSPFLLSRRFPVSRSTRRYRRSTTSASACSARARSRSTSGSISSAGARVDHENEGRDLETFYAPPIAPPTRVDAEKELLERLAAGGGRLPAAARRTRSYATVGRGFKAGGFNAASPAGSEAYGEEHTWNFEGGVKTLWAGGRVSANAAVFYIDWDDLQLNVPNPAVPGAVLHRQRRRRHQQGRRARDQRARAAPGVDVFTAIGYTQRALRRRQRLRVPSTSTATRCPTRPTTPPASARSTRASWAPATVHGRADVVLLRRVPVRRRQLPRPGRVLAGQPARRLHGAALIRRGVRPQRLRHGLHSARVPLPQLRAVGVPGRDGRAADDRGEHRPSFLAADRPLRLRLGVRFVSDDPTRCAPDGSASSPGPSACGLRGRRCDAVAVELEAAAAQVEDAPGRGFALDPVGQRVAAQAPLLLDLEQAGFAQHAQVLRDVVGRDAERAEIAPTSIGCSINSATIRTRVSSPSARSAVTQSLGCWTTGSARPRPGSRYGWLDDSESDARAMTDRATVAQTGGPGKAAAGSAAVAEEPAREHQREIGPRRDQREADEQRHQVREVGPATSSMSSPAMPAAIVRPTPTGGRKNAIPIAAMITIP